MANLSLSVFEIVFLFISAGVVGFVIHFFITNRKKLNQDMADSQKSYGGIEDWKIKYMNESEAKQKENDKLKERVFEAEENNKIFQVEMEEMKKKLRNTSQEPQQLKSETTVSSNAQIEVEDLKNQLFEAVEDNKIYQIEIEEMKKQLRKLNQEFENTKNERPASNAPGNINEELRQQLSTAEEKNKSYEAETAELKKQISKLNQELQHPGTEKSTAESRPDYYEQLRQAQQSLLDHNEKIAKLLEQVDVIKDSEEKNLEIQRSNKELSTLINDLKYQLDEKEDEISQVRKKEHLTSEMTSMLDNAYSEFEVLQNKIQKLESQLAATKMVGIDYDDLKESYYKMVHELEESKKKIAHFKEENNGLQAALERTSDKLSEANMQKQQLQKKVSYLEELNNDLQQMTAANKKLEGQIKRLGELESMLNIVSDERDKLKEKHSAGL
jgi:chromosome segregation ATPase